MYLLDINVLIALFDTAHEHHEAAHRWYGGRRPWASCSITENGLIRIASSSAYPGDLGNPHDISLQFNAFKQGSSHSFWNCQVSISSPALFRLKPLGGPKHLTDIYLLGLAVSHRSRLATFDRSIPGEAVIGGSEALETIPA